MPSIIIYWLILHTKHLYNMTDLIIKKIFYEKDAAFNIIPEINSEDSRQFRAYILELHKTYYDFYHCECFFWEYDDKNNSIIVNKKSQMVSDEILDQLKVIVQWLYDKKYRIEGSFHYRINNIIEYITSNGNDKFFNHYLLFDDKKIDEYFENNKMTEEIRTKIIIDAKNKIKKYTDISTQTNESIYPALNKETMIVLDSMHDRIIRLENKQKSQIKINNFIFKICSMIGLLTAGTFIYFHFKTENQ